jgi:hypothetical protein
MQWDGGAAVCDGVGGGFGFYGFGVPQLGGFACDAEGCVDGLVAVVAVVEEVDVAARVLAMDEGDAGVGLVLGVVEVGSDIERGDGGCGVLAGEDFALADGVDAGSVAEEFPVESVELRLVVGEAGCVGGFGTGDDGALLDEGVDSAEDGKRNVFAIGVVSASRR